MTQKLILLLACCLWGASACSEDNLLPVLPNSTQLREITEKYASGTVMVLRDQSNRDSSLPERSQVIDQVLIFPNKLSSALDKKSQAIETRLSSQTEKYLRRLQTQEKKLKKRLSAKDAVLAQQLFPNIDSQFAQLRQGPTVVSRFANVYSGHLDSLITALSFLKKSGQLVSTAGVDNCLEQFSALQDRFNQTERIRKYLSARQHLLKEHFARLGMVRELKQFRKQIYYYQAQVQEYKAVFEEPSKLEAQLMQALTKVPAFKKFFAQHSQLGQLFALPGRSSTTVAQGGVQSRAVIEQALEERFGSVTSVQQALQQNRQAAQKPLQDLKDRASQYRSGAYSNGDGSDLEPPDFRPNTQKTKSFWRRLEYGANIQTQKAKNIFPVSSDVGLSLGYKLNDKSVVGVGASYKLGLGTGWQHIDLTHQGLGFRSFLDYKLKGSFYLSGGYEQNYRSEIKSIDQLEVQSAWQVSGLVGLSKKYKVGKKLKGEMKLLWDFLSYHQLPQTQAVLFRVGYNLK